MAERIHTLDLLGENTHLQCCDYNTPVYVNHKLTLREEDPIIEMTSYEKLASKLLYLSHKHPHISYSLRILSQFMHSRRRSL